MDNHAFHRAHPRKTPFDPDAGRPRMPGKVCLYIVRARAQAQAAAGAGGSDGIGTTSRNSTQSQLLSRTSKRFAKCSAVSPGSSSNAISTSALWSPRKSLVRRITLIMRQWRCCRWAVRPGMARTVLETRRLRDGRRHRISRQSATGRGAPCLLHGRATRAIVCRRS